MYMAEYITQAEIISNGRTAVVDDTILVTGMPATAGSKALENFKPLFDAEAVARLKANGYVISGKANVGEFALDILGETSYYGAVTDADGCLAGAASSLVAAGKADCALCLDVNGAPRRAAALSETVFIKPTYGTVSRHGAIPCVCSAEQIGVAARSVAHAADTLGVIAGFDQKDGTCIHESACYHITNAEGLRVFTADELGSQKKAEDALTAAGARIRRGSFAIAEAVRSAWHVLLCAEVCNNLSRYDGVKYGYRAPVYTNIDELYTNSRSQTLGITAKSMILYGSDVLSKDRYTQCYEKALRIRRLAHETLTKLFSEYDVFLLPACSVPSYKNGSLELLYRESLFTAPASITGFPAVALRGVQLIAAPLMETKALTAAAVLEGVI